MAYDLILKFAGIPLLIAIITYILTHFQLIALNKLLKLDVSHKTRTNINIGVFISMFILTLGVVMFNEYLKNR